MTHMYMYVYIYIYTHTYNVYMYIYIYIYICLAGEEMERAFEALGVHGRPEARAGGRPRALLEK